LYKEITLTVRLSALEQESFTVEPGFERQTLMCRGVLGYPERLEWVVKAHFQNKLPQINDKHSYTDSTIDHYADEERLGVLYMKQGGIDHHQKEELSLFVDVSGAFIQKINQIIASGSAASLTLKVLVGRQFMKDTYREYKTREVQHLAEFEDIDATQLVTGAVTEIDLFLNHQSPTSFISEG